jgi:hypothetical protein
LVQAWPRSWRALLNIYRFFLGQVHSVHDATEMPGVWIFHDFKVENDDVNLEQQSNKNMKEM